MKQLERHIENKNEGILKEITPRIEQLEQKIEINWKNIEKMDNISREELEK